MVLTAYHCIKIHFDCIKVKSERTGKPKQAQRMKKRKEYKDEDGRTIANMNVDGFRWYESPEKKERRAHVAKKVGKAEKRSMFVSLAIPLICLAVGGILAYLFCFYVWLG